MGIALIAQQPLAISPEGLELLVELAKRMPTSSAGVARASSASAPALSGDVAVIPVKGPLFKDDAWWLSFFGGSSYAGIRRAFDEAMADPGVGSIVLDVDSPGGEVHGCADLAAHIFASRGAKRVEAFVSGRGDSAAYWIASAAERVTIARQGEAGSIGVRTVLIDDSKAQDMAGVRAIDVVSSQSPYKVVDPSKQADVERVRANLTALASVFVEDVARNRAVSTAKVLKDFGRGDVFVGQDAVNAGLVDAVGNLDSVLAGLAGATSNQRGNVMANQTTGAPRADMSDKTCSSCSRSLGGNSKIYCSGCYGGDGDNDGDDMKFLREVFAIAGTADRAAALGALRALKAAHEQSATLAARVEQLESDKRAAEFDALVKQGRDERKLSPALADGDWIKGLRASKDGATQLRSFLANAPALVAKPEDAPREPQAGPSVELTAEEIKVARQFTGDDPVALEARLKSLREMKAADAARSTAR